MVEDSEKKAAPVVDKTGEFFNVGAPLHAVRPGYIRRPADDLLFDTLVAGHYAHIIAPDRTGKTSLIASTSARLQNNGYKVAILDLEQISERDGGSDAGRWYYSIAYRLSRQLRLKTDLQTWWQDHSILSNRQRLVEFYVQVVLQNIPEKIVVFVDEIQCAGGMPFAEHLLASIRAAHNARTTEPAFNRLSFVLVGECDPYSLVDDPHLSPFSVSTEIRLNDFTRQDLEVFCAELNLGSADAARALDRIYYWTNGQPYLSQKLARAVAREQVEGDIDETVDQLALQQLGGRAAITSEPHMSHVHRAVMSDRKNFEGMLTVYGQVRKGIRIAYDPDSVRHRQLLALGMVVVGDNGDFRIRNRLYENVFTARWANENLPLHWRGPAIAAAIIIALTAIPFAYTQLLPKPYMRIMTNPAYDLATVSDAYTNLRSFPGHDSDADRMYQTVLENRARQAGSRREIRDISDYAAVLPDGLAIADRMQAEFWDRQYEADMRAEKRDDALLAAIESLSVSTQLRRRRAASLVGDDYPELLGTIPPQVATGVAFNAETAQLTFHNGAEIVQWSVSDGIPEQREPWLISALEVSPLLRRVVVDQAGTANRIGLTINVSHPRLDDIRMRLISPSGRTADLSFSAPSSAANEEIRIPRGQLDPLLGESLNGTWSLSVRDESTGVTGHLMSWNLSLNSQVVVENFDRGLDIPDPVERPPENTWYSPDGRYAVARALQSDSARVWDLNFAQAARTIAVPASERVLGLSAGATYLVTMSQNSVNLWRTVDGRRERSFELSGAVSGATLSDDGQHLVASYQADPDTIYEVWSLDGGDIVAEMGIAGVPALQSIDAAATRIAIADFDRAVRVWDLREGEQLAQFDLASQPSEMQLSANGQTLGVVFPDSGVALWRIDRPDVPLLSETGPGDWHLSFSPSGARVVAGNLREGMQTYRTSDGAPVGALIDPGLRAGSQGIFAFSAGEDLMVTAGAGDIARYWSVPDVAGTQESGSGVADMAWRGLGTAVVAVAADGGSIAFGDWSGHVHIEQVGAPPSDAQAASDEIDFLGHRGSVTSLAFSGDGSRVASAGSDGLVRIWNTRTGLPEPFYGRASVTTVDRMLWSPSADTLAVLGGQRIWLMDTETGEEVASIDLGEVHTAMAFSADGLLYVGGESGALRTVYPDRSGNWHLRNLWQGPSAIRHLAIADSRSRIIILDASNRASTLNPEDGTVATDVLTISGRVSEVVLSPNESRVLFRTGRWIHRALLTPTGLIHTETIRAPKAMQGARMAFHAKAGTAEDPGNSQSGDRVLLLSRVTGVAELVELRFNHANAPSLFGSRAELLREWTDRVRGPTTTAGFIREGL
jgi:WD40 repeat protein